VCPFCKILPLKFYSTRLDGLSSIAELEAMNYMLIMKIKISNNSYGGFGYSTAEYTAINRLRAAGHLFITASGNEGCNVDADFCDVSGQRVDLRRYPCVPGGYDLPNILNVGASDRYGAPSYFSNYGAKSVDVFAPGSSILSLYVPVNEDFKEVDGTSFAAPIVAGVAAMIWSRNPTWTYERVKAEILATVERYSGFVGKGVAGGIVNMHRAISSGATNTSPWPVAESPPGRLLEPEPCYKFPEPTFGGSSGLRPLLLVSIMFLTFL